MENKIRKTGIQTENKSSGWVVFLLRLTNILFLFAAILLIGRIIYLQHFYKPAPVVAEEIAPRSKKVILKAHRGDILSRDGSVLATSVPKYIIHMDCTVRKQEFAKDNLHGKEREAKWCEKARKLSEGLAEILGNKTADQYYSMIMNGRAQGSKYLLLVDTIDNITLSKLNKLPLFNEHRLWGGKRVDTLNVRQYPYGPLAHRVIGNEKNRVGIEGRFDYVLHGTDGYEYRKRTEGSKKAYIVDLDSARFLPEHGLDVHTTLDIDIQDIVYRALKEQIQHNDIIESGCAIVMEVGTGAIKAMVNLSKDKKGIPRENYNFAIGRAYDPGSVFKAVSLMTLLEEQKVTLDTKVPTDNGKWRYKDTIFEDKYLFNKPSTISVLDAFAISSNNIFRKLVCQHYDKDPRRFLSKVHEYKILENFDFDLLGLAETSIVTPGSKGWSGTALPAIAIGYSVNVTPLHIVTFYNAIAGKGKMMKPYLVQSFDRNGHPVKEFKPTILNGSICSKATADTLTKAMIAVTHKKGGTGIDLKDAKCTVAGKTGTAQIPFKDGDKTVYANKNYKQHQATFAGFFPAENPQYTAIVVLYSKFGIKDLYGSKGISTFKKIVDEMYVLNMIEK